MSSQEPLSNAVVLITGADADGRSRYETLLRSAGYEVVALADPTMAAAELGPSLIIARLEEPTVEAFGSCRELKTRIATRDTPVIVLTRCDDSYTREQIVRLGATAILVEPLRPALLLRQVRRLLTRRFVPASVSPVTA